MGTDPICGMKVDEKTGHKLSHQGKTYYFCESRCLKKFASENDIPPEQLSSCEVTEKHPFYRNKIFIVSMVLVSLVILSYAFDLLLPFRQSLFFRFQYHLF